METDHKFPAEPGTPLFQISPERVNQQRLLLNNSPTTQAENRHVRESSVHEKAAKFDSLAFQGKALERKTNDAALKRAMLGREEAENEMRRYRDEARFLKKQVEEGRDRERKVSERLENVMENYGRAKETHAHTQTLWEKEIRRARKESFKLQSTVVKIQEELKSSRTSLRAAQANVDDEKERSNQREQEAFAARYQLVGVQEQLAILSEKIKLVEQERDALRTIAKNEEVARIAAEGQIPLPSSSDDQEFASPRKASAPLPAIMIKSSVASEEELEQVKSDLQWERQRATRAFDHIDYLKVECQLRCCSCQRHQSDDQTATIQLSLDAGSALPQSSSDLEVNEDLVKASNEPLVEMNFDLPPPTTIFVPEEGVFRTIPPAPEESPWISPAKQATARHYVPQTSIPFRASVHARTPSCEPPSTAIVHEVNTSLMSLLDAPTSPESTTSTVINHGEPSTFTQISGSSRHFRQESKSDLMDSTPTTVSEPVFHTISTTTRIPLANPPDLTPPVDLASALSPTMTREEALAQIRERRGRARSLAQGTLTPRKQMVEGAGVRRDISAPAVRSGSVARGRPQGRLA